MLRPLKGGEVLATDEAFASKVPPRNRMEQQAEIVIECALHKFMFSVAASAAPGRIPPSAYSRSSRSDSIAPRSARASRLSGGPLEDDGAAAVAANFGGGGALTEGGGAADFLPNVRRAGAG